MPNRFLFLILASALLYSPLPAADPTAPELYRSVIVAGATRALDWQSDGGRYNNSQADKNRPVQDMLATTQMAIYPVAWLYRHKYPDNPFYGDRRALESVIRNGDYLAAYQPSSFWPLSQWTVHSWLSALEQVQDELDPERRARWSAAIEHWVAMYLDYLHKCEGKRQYTAVQLGTSPNHYSLYLVAVMKAGQVLGHPEWTDYARGQFRNLLRSQHPDGFWAEHDGPVNRYTWITLQGVGLYYEMTGDPEALEAIRRAKDFVLGFTYPDGSAVAVIDERNRYAPGLSPTHGLLGLGHFADGRRFCRLIAAKMAAGAADEDGSGLSNESLSHLTDALRYWEAGPEAAVPWDSQSYDRTLVSGARLMRRGDWIVTLCGIVSPPWEGNRFFLDRYTYIEVWHRKCGLVLGGGNTKRQPQIATLLMEPSHGGLDFWPRDSRITGAGDSLCLELACDKFSARLSARVIDSTELDLRVHFIETSPPMLWPNRYECNLQLQLNAGETLTAGDGPHALGPDKLNVWESNLGERISTGRWSLTVPAGRTSLRWPFLPFFNYDVDGIGGKNSAIGILSTAARIYEDDLEYRLKVN
ncbi:hypothetical protein LLH00_01840 [bacterium]|nr:hypothetical protein [bacterium]